MPELGWTATTLPSGGIGQPALVTSSSITTATFSTAGTYACLPDKASSTGTASFSVTVNVNQTLTSIVVTPGTASIQTGATQQFSVHAFDQFQKAMAAVPTIAWSASGGSINSAGLFTAPSTAAGDSITAKSGSISGVAKVTVTAPEPIPTPSPTPTPTPTPSPTPGGLKDATLASLVQKLDADGSLSRADMIQILTSVGSGGTVSATDMADLKTIITNAAQYNMPSYVQVLAGDVVNGNTANAHYQGAALGNLAAGSTATKLDDLIGKWFLGTDLPALTSTSLSYKTVSGTLFPTTPSHNNEFQGQLGDCYFISSLGTIADTNPSAIENMFINNGDGDYTVRFYGGKYGAFYNADGTVSDGFASGAGTASYVTVNLSLPIYSNSMLAYADYGANASNANNSLWIPLAEKAYAQWNETGLEGRDGTNTYNSIQGGWMATVDAQVLGHNATDYNVTASTEQAMISALASNQAVTIATDGNPSYGLYGDHAYAVTGYNAAAQMFTLYNPWGFDQPGVLTWSELVASCDGYVTANAAGSVAISGSVHSSVAAAAAQVSAAASGVSASPSTGANSNAASAVWTTGPVAETTSTGSPATAGDSSQSLWATIYSDGSDSTEVASDSPAPAGVDAVMASGDFGMVI